MCVCVSLNCMCIYCRLYNALKLVNDIFTHTATDISIRVAFASELLENNEEIFSRY